jgi:hypothetical protein
MAGNRAASYISNMNMHIIFRIFTKCTSVLLILSVWLSTLSYCAVAYVLTAKNSSSTAWLCRTTDLTSSSFLLIKPCLVITMSIVMFILYGDIIAKFWLLKSRNEEFLKRQMDNCRGATMMDIFQRRNLFKGFQGENIFEKNNPVKLVGFKTCQHSQCKSKRMDSCLGKKQYETNLRKVFRYLKDSKYVLCILAAFFFSWIPWILTYLTDFILIRSDYFHHRTTTICGNFSDVNMERLLLKIQAEIQNEEVVESLDNITNDDTDHNTVCAALVKVYEDATFDLMTRLYFTCGAISCVLDPLIYAVWYKPVRNQVWEIVDSVKSSIFNSKATKQ